jgi:hypothetical protein
LTWPSISTIYFILSRLALLSCGRYGDASQIVREGLRLLKQRELEA